MIGSHCKATPTGGWRRYALRTWQVEIGAVAATLSAVSVFSGNTPVSWLSTAAVVASFAHGQVSDRMVEQEAIRPVPSVDCYWKSIYYFIAKELLWSMVFLTSHCYPALVGVGLFLLYPAWRKYWRRIHPIKG